jgi:exonuclease III
MKIIAWNYRGLGNGAAVRGLLNVQKEEDPDVLFLSKTKMDESRINGLRWKLGLTNTIMKNCSGAQRWSCDFLAEWDQFTCARYLAYVSGC